MSTLAWVLGGVVLYSVAVYALRTTGRLPESVRIQGPLTTVHTQRGREFLDWLAGPARFWRAWSNLGLGAVLVLMVGLFGLLVTRALQVLRNPPEPSAVNDPQNALVIPGVNDFLPLSVAPEIVAGLLIGLVVHEGGHGLLCRVEGIDIDSMGLVFLTLLPIGAFVQPDEESQRSADRGGRARMFVAGVTNNFAVTVIAFLLLVGPVAGSIAVAPGAAVGDVFPGSAAADAGIERGDRIVAVGDTEIQSNADLFEYLTTSDRQTVQVELADGSTKAVERALLVTAIAPDSPLTGEDGISLNDTVVAINGTAVHTEAGLRGTLADRHVATVETADGDEVTAPVGVMARAVPDEPLADEGMPTGDRFVVTAIDGQRVLTPGDVTEALVGTEPGDEVTVVAFVEDQRHDLTVTLSEGPDGGGFLGIAPSAGYSGLTVNSLGVKPYPADAFLGLLGGGEDQSLLSRTLTVLVLPLIGSVFPGFDYNFAGFVEANVGFYEIVGPLEPLGGAVFLLANLLFWTGWVNLNLAFFNCIPAFPLDGGRILRAGTESVVARLPVEEKHVLARLVTTSVGLTMLASLILMLFGPQLLN